MTDTSIEPIRAISGGQKVLAAAKQLKQQLNDVYGLGELDNTIYSSLTISVNSAIGKAAEYIKLNETKHLRAGGSFYEPFLPGRNNRKGMIINERT